MKEQEILTKLATTGCRKIKFAVCDIDGILRSKTIHFDKIKNNINREIGFCDVIFGWDSNDECYSPNDFTGWHTGYPDQTCRLDSDTFRQIPWDQQTPFFLADFSHQVNRFIPCPRTLLKKIIRQAADLDYKALFGAEFEWMNFQSFPGGTPEALITNPVPITSGMFGYSQTRPMHYREYFNQLFTDLANFDIPLESLHTETGPGVYEAAIGYDQVLQAADKATLFKSSVKEIALQHRITASFMARWNEQLPGCGGHLHQSLQGVTGKTNLFGKTNHPEKPNTLTQNYMAGLLHCLPEILPMYAPTINSYKRLKSGSWAPTTASWGTDNRTVAVRYIPGDSPSATHIELRVPGADINPYLAMAASLASGLYGIKHQLKLPDESLGNAYTQKAPKLSKNLSEATQKMKQSKLSSELFGADFVRHFCQSREWEWLKFEKAVTNWEINRYLEII